MMRKLLPGIPNYTASPMTKIHDQLVKNTIKTYLNAQNTSPRLGTDPAPNPAADNLAKYGMCDMELERYMVMYRIKPGRELLILKWVAILANKVLFKEGKNNIFQTVYEDLRYEDCKIPMITQTLQFLKEKSFSGDYDAETALAAMKVLSIYIMAPLK